jgi:hypothetical protein
MKFLTLKFLTTHSQPQSFLKKYKSQNIGEKSAKNHNRKTLTNKARPKAITKIA